MFSFIGNLGNKKKLTLMEISELWLQSKRFSVKSSTYCNYKRNLEDHIYPSIGSLKYSSITKQQLNQFVETLLISGRKDGSGGLSKGTVKDIITLLKSVSKFAHSEFQLKNICDNLKLFKVKKTKFKSYLKKSEKNLNHFYLVNLHCPIYAFY